MKGLPFLQFRLHDLMAVIAMLAGVLALNQWGGIGLALPMMAFPSSLLVERLFGTPLPAPLKPSEGSSFARSFVLLAACASFSTFLAWYGCSDGVPTVLSPMPWLTFTPLFLASVRGYAQPWWFVVPIPFGTFFLMNSYQLRVARLDSLPMRFSFLLGVATAFFVLFFATSWQPGVRYQGLFFTATSAAINLTVLVVLWGWWFAIRRRISKAGALAFATLLHYWLFWFALPYLGDLP
jgi:hypothetical protein